MWPPSRDVEYSFGASHLDFGENETILTQNSGNGVFLFFHLFRNIVSRYLVAKPEVSIHKIQQLAHEKRHNSTKRKEVEPSM